MLPGAIAVAVVLTAALAWAAWRLLMVTYRVFERRAEERTPNPAPVRGPQDPTGSGRV